MLVLSHKENLLDATGELKKVIFHGDNWEIVWQKKNNNVKNDSNMVVLLIKLKEKWFRRS